jgi:predicted RNA binding protein YcfA (HicA-like mRNA interferase family)
MKVREVIRRLEADGWRLVRQRGSHRQFRHPTRPGTVTVGESPEETIELMRGAVTMHFESMRESGEAAPRPTSQGVYIAA